MKKASTLKQLQEIQHKHEKELQTVVQAAHKRLVEIKHIRASLDREESEIRKLFGAQHIENQHPPVAYMSRVRPAKEQRDGQWRPRVEGGVNRSPTSFIYYSTIVKLRGRDVIMIYGAKRGEMTRRALSAETLAMMVRGKLGVGQVGVNALAPARSHQKKVDISSFADPGCPYREAFAVACKVVDAELPEKFEKPDWFEKMVAK